MPVFSHEAELVAFLSIFMLIDAVTGHKIFHFKNNKLLVCLFCFQILYMLWQRCFYNMYQDKIQTFLIRHILVLPILLVSMDIKYINKILNISIKYILIIDVVYLLLWPIKGNNGSFINNYQYVAAYSSILVLIQLAKLFVDTYFPKEDVVIMLIGMLTLLMTGKRSYLIVIAVCFLVGIVFFRSKYKNSKIMKVITPLILGLLLIMVFKPDLLNSIIRFSELSTDSSLSGRTRLWDLAGYLWKTNYWNGIGYGAFSTFTSNHMGYVYSLFGVQNTYAAHNIYVQLLAETGVIGFCIFISFFVVALILTIRKLVQAKKSENNVKFIIITGLFLQLWFLIYGMSGNPLYMPGQFGLYLFAIMISNSVKINKNNMI